MNAKHVDVDIDADTGSVRPRRMNDGGMVGSYPVNPQFATTVTWLALGFIAGIVFVEWKNQSSNPKKSRNFFSKII